METLLLPFTTDHCSADLSVGYFIYPSQIGLLTGWIHHSVYIALMIYCSTVREWAIFVIGAVMEVSDSDLRP